MIPARDEADVIACTIDHMSSLDYPHNRYEIVVITDGKELCDRIHGTITTQDVVEESIEECAVRKDCPAIKHFSVPYDYDDRVKGIMLGREI